MFPFPSAVNTPAPAAAADDASPKIEKPYPPLMLLTVKPAAGAARVAADALDTTALQPAARNESRKIKPKGRDFMLSDPILCARIVYHSTACAVHDIYGYWWRFDTWTCRPAISPFTERSFC